MKPRFTGRVVVVTGGSSGIGFETARRFANEGAKVAILSRTEDRGEQAAEQIREEGGQAQFFSCDVSDQYSVFSAISRTVQEFTSISVLVNNAGTAGISIFPDEALSGWEDVLRVNLTGTYLVSQAAWPHLVLSEHAAIVNITSMAAVNGFNDDTLKRSHNLNASASYYASKAGIEGFTRYAASVGSRDGIRVNAVRPGEILTESATGPDGRHVFADVLEPLQMLPGPGRPDDVASSVLFLCSGEARFITGTVLNLDGGSFGKV